MEFINLKAQYQAYQSEIDRAIQSVLESGHFIMGPSIKALEDELAQFVNVPYCLGVSSGTDALSLALQALQIGPGDEVISVPYTWISPVECIKRVGAKPILVDIDLDTYVIDVNQIEEAITPRTKAIIPVSLYGQMPNFEVIQKIADHYGLIVIEDGSQSFGAQQNQNFSCGVSTIGVTSFFPTKPLGCYGDGGAVFTHDKALYEMMFALRVHGAPTRYHHQYVGQNARLDTLQAAILRVKLKYFEKELRRRKEIAEYYNIHLKDVVQTPFKLSQNTHTYAQYVLRSPQRSQIIQHLAEKKVPYGLYYPICIHLQPAYQDLGYFEGSFPNAEQASQETFCLPMHAFLTTQEQDIIIEAVKEVVDQPIYSV